MKHIQVLGSGCAKCVKTAELINAIAAEKQQVIELEKVSDPMVYLEYNVLKTPSVVIDGALVHSGSIPLRTEVEAWF